MYSIRPGTRVPRGQQSFKNRPEAIPPVLLRLVAAMSLISVVGMLVYAVVERLTERGDVYLLPGDALLVVGLHFVLPFGVVYTVSTNSGWSRHLIAIYAIVLGTATALGVGFLGTLPMSELTRITISISAVLVIGVWLFGSSKMRLYYALVAGKPIPDDLAPQLRNLLVPSTFARRAASAIDWAADRMETIVLLGFVALALYAWFRTSG